MNRRNMHPSLQGTMRALDAALTRPGDHRMALWCALSERATSETERAAIWALETAMVRNVAYNCDPDAMREAAMHLRDAADALATELEQGADYAECGDARMRAAE